MCKEGDLVVITFFGILFICIYQKLVDIDNNLILINQQNNQQNIQQNIQQNNSINNDRIGNLKEDDNFKKKEIPFGIYL